MSAVQHLEPPAPVVRDNDQTSPPVAPAPSAPNFEVVIDKPDINREDFERFPELEDIGPIEPAYYYEDMGIPVFTPTMDQFRSFKKFVDKINHYGMETGIIKIIPPKEWIDSLPTLNEKVKDIKIKNPIEQHIAGVGGEYRQTNIEKQRTYNLPEWRRLCEGSDHQPPARRGERRKGQSAPVVKRSTRGRKSVVPKVEEDAEEPLMAKPPTPKSPNGAAAEDRSVGPEKETSIVPESTPDPVTDVHGRQPRKKRIFKTAKQRAAEREIADEEAFEGFDFAIQDAESYTPERCDELEKAYWRTLTYNSPLYGADMPGSLFDETTTSWNVANLENILNCLGKKLPGVNTAYLYLGMWKSTFAWHLEDMDLYSINYIHFGAPKQWYSISRTDKERFEQIMKSIYPNDAKKCTEFLRHKTFLVSPSLLAQHGIKVNKLVHHQGEFVITFPFGYHSGYNLGYNCAESVNFATESWLDFGRNAKKCECVEDSVFVDVDEIERKLRGDPTEDEYYSDDYSDEFDDEDRELRRRNGDMPTPPESVEGALANERKHRRKRDADKTRRVRLKAAKVPANAPCILCPNESPYEPLLPIDKSDTVAHRLCAIYTPETYFKIDESTQTEVVANLDEIPKARLELKCFFCRTKRGSCIQCSAKKCHRAYHATCAGAAGVLVNMVETTIADEDGIQHPRTNIDFRCRYHRPKRPDVSTEKLEGDPMIQDLAAVLLPGDLIQMQYATGQVFAGVVVENRKEEATVLVETVPRGETLEVEWKWILAQDTSRTDFPDAITTAPLFPDPNYRPIGRAQPDTTGIPQPDDEFGGSFKWAEFIIENIASSPEQQPVNLSKTFWYYLGEQSTESISKFTEDPAKRIANEAANFITPRRAAPKKLKPLVSRQFNYQPYLGHPNKYWQPQDYAVHAGYHHAGNNGWPNPSGYRPQFHGASPTLYAPVNMPRPNIMLYQPQPPHSSAPMATMAPAAMNMHPTASAQPFVVAPNHHPEQRATPTAYRSPSELSGQAHMSPINQSTPIPSPITPATTQPPYNNYFPSTNGTGRQSGYSTPHPLSCAQEPAATVTAPASQVDAHTVASLTAGQQNIEAPLKDITAALTKIASRTAAATPPQPPSTFSAQASRV